MRKQLMCIAGAALLLASCQRDPVDDVLAEGSDAEILALAMEFGALPTSDRRNGPNMNRQGDKERLGRLLFYDPILSGEKDVSCATCHHPDFGYADGRALPIGVGGRGLGPERIDGVADDIGIVGRNAPTVINTAFNGIDRSGRFDPATAPMFWDNRAHSLEEQAQGPPQSFEEMRGHAYLAEVALDSIVERLRDNREYQDLFRKAFGGQNSISIANMAGAIAEFERGIVANNAPFDRFVRGENNALSQQEKNGLRSFVEAGCAACHNGPMFSDWQLHAIGVPESPLRDSPDSGANGSYQFRTPTLRNLEFTGPFFHNGIAEDLRQVMRHYLAAQDAAQQGGAPSFNPNVPELSPALAAQQLREDQVDDIIAFMGSLNDGDFDRMIPSSVPSGLPVGGLIGP